MLVKCTDVGTPNGGNIIYINPEHIAVIGITNIEQTVANNVTIPMGSALVWVGARNFAIAGADLEKILQAVDIADTKVVFTRSVEDALKNTPKT